MPFSTKSFVCPKLKHGGFSWVSKRFYPNIFKQDIFNFIAAIGPQFKYTVKFSKIHNPLLGKNIYILKYQIRYISIRRSSQTNEDRMGIISP
ncbi:hypothetical protein D3C73_959240 [compost metagenome]